MLKAGLLPSPIITPLSSGLASSKNKINTQTFVELRTGLFSDEHLLLLILIYFSN